MGFAGMQRDTVTGLNLAVNKLDNPQTRRWTSQDPLESGGGTRSLRHNDNEPHLRKVDPSGLKYGIWNDKTGWTSESGDDVFKRLVTQLGGQPANMQALKDSDLWKNLVDSPTWIEVKFLKMGGNTKGEGGRTYKDDFMGGISSTVGPDMANNPKGSSISSTR